MEVIVDHCFGPDKFGLPPKNWADLYYIWAVVVHHKVKSSCRGALQHHWRHLWERLWDQEEERKKIEGGQQCDPTAAVGFLRTVFFVLFSLKCFHKIFLCFHLPRTDQTTTPKRHNYIERFYISFRLNCFSSSQFIWAPNTHKHTLSVIHAQIQEYKEEFWVSISLVISIVMFSWTRWLFQTGEERRQFSALLKQLNLVSIYFEILPPSLSLSLSAVQLFSDSSKTVGFAHIVITAFESPRFFTIMVTTGWILCFWLLYT